MLKPFVTLISFLAVLAASLGLASTTTASAAVTAPSWPKTVVYVYDTTAGLKKADGTPVWPVKAAAERWDNDNPVDYRYTAKPCPAGAQCVVVKQQELAGNTVGSAVTGSIGTELVSATVTLDKTFGARNSATRRRNVACHELGHALGLAHRSGETSCMTSYVTNQRNPDKTDVTTLVRMYTR
ncbi:matrixin family metalloprotease [uncultured Friedmanniella sp.]|uniref:matrixin family metalloprotease n=1 Tax=uncultured Friedmanniella sp. TaxID=335381 RepID=UPI0035C966FA